MAYVAKLLEGNMEHIVEDGIVTITYEELVKLREDSLKLNCLMNAGVDSWTWYDDAMDDFRDQLGGDE